MNGHGRLCGYRKDGELVEMVEKRPSQSSVVTKSGRSTSFLTTIVLLVVSVILVVVGISLIVLSSRYRSCRDKNTSERSDYCALSVEGKRAGLDNFLKKVQHGFFKHHPHKSYHDPRMDTEDNYEAMKRAYKPFMPKPEILKRITDASLELLSELKAMKINREKLKPREKKVLYQAEHFLQHAFGQPYDVNYYAGDWLLGPNLFCWQPVCGIGYDIFYHLDYFKPNDLDGLQQLREKLKEQADGIYQYIANMKDGVRRGMVRSVEDCRAGIDAVKQQYLNISLRNETGVLDSWFMKLVVGQDFLLDISKDEDEQWRRKTGMTVKETVRKYFVEFIGKPIVQLIRYLEQDHVRHCLPSSISSGLASLPQDYVYLDGVRTNIKTNKTLPTGEPLNGSKTYEMILSYFTTNDMKPRDLYQLGQKQVGLLYPQILEIARNVTKRSNDSEAIEKFREFLDDRSNYFNNEPFPQNESNEEAHAKCSSVEGAKKYCPKRWEALQKWWSAARMAMSLLDPKTIDMFYFTGKKHTTPSCPVELEPDLNPSSSAQSYIESDKKCTVVAKYSLPFFLDNAGPRFSEWSVNAHEARPGHHTQVQGAIEHFLDNCQDTISWLDKVTYYPAYVEGWGLYAESPLISDTDVYDENIMQKYGMLKWQVWRAVRLVVDTGIHYTGLTRNEALELFHKFALDNSDMATKEVTRYQSNFGQATAYMIGQLALVHLREDAKKRLGEKFNLKEFHYQVLSQGSSPLAYLTSHVQKYVECELNNQEEGCDVIRSPPRMPAEREERRKVAGKKAKRELPEIFRRHYL